MNKKIKIIELLNRIANREEVPKEIKVNGLDFIWKTLDDGAGYFDIEEGHWLEDCISLDSAEDLNTEVEILEDNIEEIKELETGTITTEDRLKINEIIRAVNRLIKESEDKQNIINQMREEKE